MRTPRFAPWLVVATLTAAGAAAAAGYGLTAPKRYTATAQLLVVPVSAADPTFTGLDVFHDASGRRTAAASASVLIASPQVADAVRAQLGLRESSTELLGDLDARVARGSDVVDVTAEASGATVAAQLANAFVDAFLAERTATFQSELASAVRRDAQLLRTTSGPQAVELAHRLGIMRSFQGQPDPTLRRGDSAVAPAAASWPNVPVLVGIGAGIGLGLGGLSALTAFALRRKRPRAPTYDREMREPSLERAVDALAERLERRLAARESALAVRERDLQARIDELRGLEAGVSAQPVTADAERERRLTEREAELEERLSFVTSRELEVGRREAAAAGDGERERQLAEREAALEQRVALVSRRELELARRAAAERVSQPQPQPQPEPAPAPPPESIAGGRGAYNLSELERLVEDLAGAHPDRVDEWRSYIYFLRDYATADGSLPGSFDWLILDTFRELMA